MLWIIPGDNNVNYHLHIYFVNQLRNAFSIHPALVEATVELTDRGDFWVKSAYTFEIGGKTKTYDQLKGVKKSYIAADDIETGFGNKIPLWMFGFLY